MAGGWPSKVNLTREELHRDDPSVLGRNLVEPNGFADDGHWLVAP